MKMETKNIVIIILIIITIIIGLLYLNDKYSKKEVITPEEQAKIEIDEYNFSQLEKAKQILNNIGKDEQKFFTLKEFNKKYNANIKPIKNCYYISNSNGDKLYIFGFQLESKKYIKKYGNQNYAYPKYDLPVEYICGGGKKCDYDIVYGTFHKTI